MKNATALRPRTASSAVRFTLLLCLLVVLGAPAQAQDLRLGSSPLFAGPGDGLKTQDFTCACDAASGSNKFTSMTLRYEDTTAGEVFIKNGSGGFVSLGTKSFGDQFTFIPTGTSVQFKIGTGSAATIQTNCGATSGLLRSTIFPTGGSGALRVIAYSDGTPTTNVCKGIHDLACSPPLPTPSTTTPNPGDNVTFNVTFRNKSVGGSPTMNAINATMTVTYDPANWTFVSQGTFPGTVTFTGQTPGQINYVINVPFPSGQSVTVSNITLQVKNPPTNPSNNVVTFAMSGDLNEPNPDDGDNSCPVPFSALPVELIAFDAVTDGRAVMLQWKTSSETNNAGFEVQHRYDGAAKSQGGAFEALDFVQGFGTTEQAQDYSFRVGDLEPGLHTFRLKQVDYDGTFEYSPEVEVAVEMPEAFLVSDIYPNPFNPQASFSFGVRQQQQVTVEIFNLLGKRVAQLYRGSPEAGTTRTLQIDGSGWPSGLYIVRVLGESFVHTQTVTLLK